ncbi:MAG: hypothetical protein QHH75_13945 [Bacillota bacterium]|nr:hypothetical protein [Bacillota bacterium]
MKNLILLWGVQSGEKALGFTGSTLLQKLVYLLERRVAGVQKLIYLAR